MKNILYLDIEDDITAIISKLKKTKDDFVKLVPAKRSTVFTSVVNLKLLKKAAEDHEKDFALVTKNAHLESLASELDIKVAESTTAEPAVPEKKESAELPSTTISAEDTQPDQSADERAEGEAPAGDEEEGVVGKLAAVWATTLAYLGGIFKKGGQEASEKGDHSTTKGVPNFRKFRKKLILSVLALALIGGGGVYALLNAPKAKVTLQAQTRTSRADFEFIADSEADVADTEKSVVPAKAETITKSATSNFTPTGEKNVGEKASGIITIENCASSSSYELVEGTTFQAPDKKKFFSTQTVTVPGATIESTNGDYSCVEPGTVDVPVIAEERGDIYNLAPTSYTIPNLEEDYKSDTDANGGQMSGGTTKIAKIVTQSDVDNAKRKLLNSDIEQTKLEFANRFEEEVIVLDDSFTQTVDSVSSNPKVNQQLPEGESEATLEVELTYFQFALEKNQLEILLHDSLGSELKEGEKIREEGTEEAEIELVSKISQNQQKFSFKTESVIGPDIDKEQLASEIAGMGYSEAIEHAESRLHVIKALVDLSPFWVFTIPDRPEQITIDIEIIEQE